jgi:hypothetical protein
MRIRVARKRVRKGPSAAETSPAPARARTHAQSSERARRVPVYASERAPAISLNVQPKLNVSRPADPAEREADRVADGVLSSHAAPEISAQPNPTARQVAEEEREEEAAAVQRKCDDCEEEKEGAAVQRKAPAAGGHAGPPAAGQGLGGGRPIPAPARGFFESRFGQDFSDVRVHTDAGAARSARSIDARAYTEGRDIVFGAGEFAPGTERGDRLLAHELTHVVQQRGAGQRRTDRKPATPQPKPAASREALERQYRIRVESGNKDWSQSDLEDLLWSLSKLTREEAAALAGYRFLRWTTPDDRRKVDPSYEPRKEEECGLHEPNLEKKSFKISMYDACFDPNSTMADVPIGRFNLLHEIGHAIEIAELRRARAESDEAWAAYEAAKNEYDAASPAEQKKLLARVKKLDAADDAARKRLDAARGRSLAEFGTRIKGKPALTEFAQTSPAQAFAEGFALYKIDPSGIGKNYPELAEWFKKQGHLRPSK